MSKNDFNFDFELDLLIPWDIPLDYKLDLKQKEKLSRSLNLLLESLKLISIDEALKKIEQALENLGSVESIKVKIDQTKTSLKSWEVQDYDNYFEINRIQTEEPAACLIKSLLVNCQAFLLVCKNHQKLDITQVEMQKQGFISYAYLLARNFQLDINP